MGVKGCFEGFCNILGCSCCGTEEQEDGSKSMTKARVCTDLPFCLTFILALVLMIVVWAQQTGDINDIKTPHDYHGNRCGSKDTIGGVSVETLPYGMFPDPTAPLFIICIESCDKTAMDEWQKSLTNGQQNSLYPYNSVAAGKYCVPSPVAAGKDTNTTEMILKYDTNNDTMLDASELDTFLKSGDVSTTERFTGHEDVEDAKYWILLAAGISLGLGFAYVILMRSCLKTVVCIAILGIILGGLLGFAYFYLVKGDSTSQVIGIIIAVFTGLFLVMAMMMRQQIRIAIAVIQIAGKSLFDLPMLLLFPFLGQVFVLGFFVLWMIYTAIMFVSAEKASTASPPMLPTLPNTYGEVYPSTYKAVDYMAVCATTEFMFHFFMMLWFVQFLTYMFYSIQAGAIADWYFTRKDENDKRKRGGGDDEMSNWTILMAIKRSLFNLGSIALAALIIAIIEFTRWVVRYISAQLRGRENKILKMILAAIDCILRCLKCCIDKVNKKAIIYIAVTGKPLCFAFCESFKIIWMNMARIAVMFVFTKSILLIGKVVVTLGGFVLGLLLLMQNQPDNGLVLPAVFMLLICYVVANNFMTLYETAVDTVFMCFLLDEKWNAGKDGIMYADPALGRIIGENENASKKLAAKNGEGEENEAKSVKVHPQGDDKKEGVQI